MAEHEVRDRQPMDDVGERALRGGPLAWALVLLLVALGIALFAVSLLMRRWDLPMGAGPASKIEVQVAEPRLEVAPQPALVQFRAQQRARLESYGWVDREHGIAHIPIEEAMRLMMRRAGAAPAQDPSAVPPAESARSAGDGRRVAPMLRCCHSKSPSPGAGRHPLPRAREGIAAPPLAARDSPFAFIATASAAVPPPKAGFTQKLGGQLPLEARFTNAEGRRVLLGEYFARDPVVLVLGYYHCKRLCTGVMDGVILALSAVDVPFRVVAVSIDPDENRELAASRQAAYARLATRPEAAPQLLLGTPPEITRLAQAAGFDYRRDAQQDEYAHAAGFIVATPEGRVSRYFFGLRFDPRDLRLALIEASQGRLGSPIDRLVLLCSHYDPATGRYSFAVMGVVRAVALVMVAVLGLWIWRHRRASGEGRR